MFGSFFCLFFICISHTSAFCATTVIFLRCATVFCFDEELSKTISLEQFKWSAFNDVSKTEHEVVEKVDHAPTSSVAKVSSPRYSISTPRQSKISGTTPRSARSGTRGTYVKSKSGSAKHGHRETTSPSSVSKLAASQSSAKKVVDAEPAVVTEASVIDPYRRVSVDAVAVTFSQPFAGSFASFFHHCQARAF